MSELEYVNKKNMIGHVCVLDQLFKNKPVLSNLFIKAAKQDHWWALESIDEYGSHIQEEDLAELSKTLIGAFVMAAKEDSYLAMMSVAKIVPYIQKENRAAFGEELLDVGKETSSVLDVVDECALCIQSEKGRAELSKVLLKNFINMANNYPQEALQCVVKVGPHIQEGEQVAFSELLVTAKNEYPEIYDENSKAVDKYIKADDYTNEPDGMGGP